MANIGLTNLWYSKLTEADDGTAIYEGAKNFGKAVSCSVSITNNSATLYGDDALAETDTSFASGTITLGVTDDDETVFADVLGHTIEDGEVIKTSNDTAPYVGVGRIVTKMVNGTYKYKVEFLYKVKFSEGNKDENTKGENIEFATPSIEGMIATLNDVNGTWSKSKTFNSKVDALTYLKGLLSAPVTTYTVTYDVNGGTGTIAPVTVAEGSSVSLNDGSTIVPPTNKTFVGWATTSDAVTADVSSPYTPTGDITLYAVYADTVATYTVTYNLNGGTGTIEPVTVTQGESVTLDDGEGITPPTAEPAVFFSGWALTDSATYADVLESPYTPTGNVTLYAVYTAD